jgi:hypothetical protein
MYFQAFFVFDRIKVLAPAHPEWETQEPFASVLKGDLNSALAGGEHALVEMVMATHLGILAAGFLACCVGALPFSVHAQSIESDVTPESAALVKDDEHYALPDIGDKTLAEAEVTDEHDRCG